LYQSISDKEELVFNLSDLFEGDWCCESVELA